jgi:signal transduction histidine kinase
MSPLVELEHVRKDGRRVLVEMHVSRAMKNGVPVGRLAVARDITERRSLEDQLRQAQKMEGIGRLAGGIAHDFNNLLTAIGGRCYLVLDQLAPDHPLRHDLEIVQDAAERAARLTHQLLAFSRKQVLEPRVLDLTATVADIEPLLQRLIGEDIEVTMTLGSALGSVKVDPGQIEQLIINLAVNARDAMPQGGRLTLLTANVSLDEAYARLHAGVEPGRYVMLVVNDTGHGMDATTQARIFEPFFTTKEEGKGTGLGLATVYGIVKQSNGHIAVESAPGQGATFKIYLPIVDALPTTDAPVKGSGATPRGSETVLLVEDDEALRSLAREILQVQGYTVLEAGVPGDAMRIAAGHQTPIHLLVTDVVMPQMNGKQLADRLRSGRPELKVLFMSGYTDSAIVEHGVLEPGIQFLHKPFTPAGLGAKVREALDR